VIFRVPWLFSAGFPVFHLYHVAFSRASERSNSCWSFTLRLWPVARLAFGRGSMDVFEEERRGGCVEALSNKGLEISTRLERFECFKPASLRCYR
jgi:hypothetical protein